MTAGHETSATALSWCLYVMATRQDIQSRLRDEIRALVSEAPNPVYTEIGQLRYLDHFVKETLRVFSPGAFPPCHNLGANTCPNVAHIYSNNPTSPV